MSIEAVTMGYFSTRGLRETWREIARNARVFALVVLKHFDSDFIVVVFVYC